MNRLLWTMAVSRLVSIVMMIIGELFRHMIISQESMNVLLSMCTGLVQDIASEAAKASVDVKRENPESSDETE